MKENFYIAMVFVANFFSVSMLVVVLCAVTGLEIDTGAFVAAAILSLVTSTASLTVFRIWMAVEKVKFITKDLS